MQRRKLRALAVAAVTAGVLSVPSTAGALPRGERREYPSLVAFEHDCHAEGGHATAWGTRDTLWCEVPFGWWVWTVWPFHWRGPGAERAIAELEARNPDSCPGCGGGGAW